MDQGGPSARFCQLLALCRWPTPAWPKVALREYRSAGRYWRRPGRRARLFDTMGAMKAGE